MYNVLITREEDPEVEFGGLWHNKNSGAIWIWAGKPIMVGFSKDGMLVKADVFEADFVHTPIRNKQEYSVTYEYGKIPLIMIAEVDGDDESEVTISLGSLYGVTDINDKHVIINPIGNVEIGANLTMECLPTQGHVKVKLTVISYE